MSWFLRVSVSVGREGCISFQTWNPVAETCSRLQICFAIWLHLSTGWCASTHGKAGSRLIATNCSEFIGKDKWPPNSPDLNPLDYHVWGDMLERYKSFQPSRRTSMSSRKFCSWYGTSCHRTRSTKPYWASQKDFGLVWKLVVDTSNIHHWSVATSSVSLLSIITFLLKMVSVIFAVLEVSFWALTTVVKLPWKFLTLISVNANQHTKFLFPRLISFGDRPIEGNQNQMWDCYLCFEHITTLTVLGKVIQFMSSEFL